MNMAIEYDEKGKFFTEVISKDVVLCLMQTQSHHIRGYVHVRKEERLSDEINRDNNFLALTTVEIYSTEGETLFTSDFLAVNREHIIWLMPVEERQEKPNQPED
jgi:hypothetical protein